MNAISVRHLSKEFELAATRPGYRNFRDFLRVPRRDAGTASRRFAALSDVSFDVRPGEVVGIVGRNGAGKSTLLKILSRVLRPTSGRVELRGRVGSLLEVGAGFHPDLTGRENVFLNGAILGMTHAEIVRKMGEIVAFAGVEQHIDEPVKHYSSGMYMRLAFAVAAHIEPEILLLDEVLAVGDAEFQRKSVERIQQVGRHGQTVIIVSHDIQTVLRLCHRALFLDAGNLIAFGDPSDVTAQYLRIGDRSRGIRTYADGPHAPGDAIVRLREVRVHDTTGAPLDTVDIGAPCGITVEFDVTAETTLCPSLTLSTERGPVIWATDTGTEWHGVVRRTGAYRETAWIPANLLSPGVVRVSVAMHSFRPNREHFVEPDCVVFQTVETEGGSRGVFIGKVDSAVRPLLRWDVEHHPAPRAATESRQ